MVDWIHYSSYRIRRKKIARERKTMVSHNNTTPLYQYTHVFAVTTCSFCETNMSRLLRRPTAAVQSSCGKSVGQLYEHSIGYTARRADVSTTVSSTINPGMRLNRNLFGETAQFVPHTLATEVPKFAKIHPAHPRQQIAYPHPTGTVIQHLFISDRIHSSSKHATAPASQQQPTRKSS